MFRPEINTIKFNYFPRKKRTKLNPFPVKIKANASKGSEYMLPNKSKKRESFFRSKIIFCSISRNLNCYLQKK